MAIDESLLKNFNEGDLPILRLYRWDENSATIGISQDVKQYSHIVKNNNIAKRITGGGVLFHGHDISYSLVIPSSYLENLSIKKSYEYICGFILEFYKTLGLRVSFAKDNKNIELSKNEYCQVGFEAYDILLNGKKIGGNAQRRTKKAVFQHGSIPIFKSEVKGETKGISLEDLDIKISYEELIKKLSESFESCFKVQLKSSNLFENELELTKSLLRQKYDYSRKKT